jgi:hypothetical protein
MDPDRLAQTAVEIGTVSPAAQPAVAEIVRDANSDLGIKPREVEASRVFLVKVLIDNSGSMGPPPDENLKIVTSVRKAMQQLKDELNAAAREADDCEILLSLDLLHGGQLQPFARVEDCGGLSDENHRCDGNTPLINRAKQLLGTMLAKVDEMSVSGRSAQTFTVFISDGVADDMAEVAVVKETIGGMTSTKNHIVCGISIGGEATSTFVAMGIPQKWILAPDKDSFAFEQAIKKVSRASRAASKGGARFQSVATDGYR